MYTAFTCDLERQRVDHERMLEDVVKRYRKNIIAINKIHNKCNQDVANITYLFIYLFEKILKVSSLKTTFLLSAAVYFCSTKYERKQLVLYKTWELEQKNVQLALENAIDDLKSLKQMNKELEEDVRERRYTEV